MRFDNIPGLESKKAQLVAAARGNHVAHAQLFSGKPGSPNLPMALAYATYLNCEHPTEHDACGQCPSCAKNAKFVHPDLHFVFPVSATKNVKAEEAISEKFLPQWREFLLTNPYGDLDAWSAIYGGEDKQVNISKRESREIIKNLSLKAFEGRYKIMIVWLPEYMHQTAANGILKILEEPPENTVFILVTNAYDKLLTTITSRTQMVTIPLLENEAVKNLLIEKHDVAPDRAEVMASLADGDYQAALKLASNMENDSHTFFAEWMRSCFRKDLPELVERSENFHKSNKLAQRSLFKYSLTIMRESLVYKHASDLNKVNGNVLEFVRKFSTALDEERINKISELIGEAHFHLERNGSPKMIFLDLSLQIAMNIK